MLIVIKMNPNHSVTPPIAFLLFTKHQNHTIGTKLLQTVTWSLYIYNKSSSKRNHDINSICQLFGYNQLHAAQSQQPFVL